MTPAARAVVMLWASSLPAPVAEAVLPLRSRARAMTGAVIGVLIVASWMFRPRTLAVAERGALLGVAVDLADGVVDIDERDPLGVAAGEQPGTRSTARPAARHRPCRAAARARG